MTTRRIIRFSIFTLLATSLLFMGTAQAGKVSVTAADPPEAEQETIGLDVTIDGEGFDDGTQVTFLVAGNRNDTGGINVTRNHFVNPNQMIATIDIAPAAIVGDFDIAVETSRGRRGKGNTLFHVLQKGGGGGSKSGTAWVNDNDVFYRVRGDGPVGEGNFSVYIDDSIEHDCVSVIADDPNTNRGFFQLRTVKNTDACNQNPLRWLVLDLGEGNGCDVDQDGTSEAVESVYARFIAGEAYSRDAEENGTSVEILILETSYDVNNEVTNTTQETAWVLTYSNNAEVTVDDPPGDPNIRTISYWGSQFGPSTAELCEIQLQPRGKKFKKVCVPCGDSVEMPFELLATRHPG